jgi:dolichol-phosphate mannosyltransferase
MKEKSYKKAVIVAVYNERENIIPLCRALLNTDKDFVIILSVSHSPDGTQELANSLVRENERVIMVRPQKRDLDVTLLEGLKKALELNVDWMVTMDGDFSHEPQDIPRLFEKGKENDLVIGSRYLKGGKIIQWDWKRKTISWGARALNRLILDIKLKDSTSGFRCYSRALVKHLISYPFVTQGFTFQTETAVRIERGGWKICEIPITFREREKGCSKLDSKEIKRYLVGIFRLRKGSN